MQPIFESKALLWIVCALATPLLCQCGSTQGTPHATYHPAASQSQSGVVTSSQAVKTKRVTGLGRAIGSIGGAILGSRVGSGNTAHFAGSVAGSLLGGVGGSAAEAKLSKGRAQHITILSEGRTYRVVSNGKHPLFRGDRVRIQTNGSGKVLRVIPLR